MSFGPYGAIVGARFRTLLQYRAAAIAGVWTQIFFGLVLIMIYEAFYLSSSGGAAAQPLSHAQVITYVWLAQSMFAMLPWNADNDVRGMVRSGGIAYELVRPVDMYALWFSRAVAMRTAPTLLRVLPLLLFAMVLLPLVGLEEWRLPPPRPLAGLAFAATLAGALLLSCAISTLINITLLWTIAGDGIVMIASTLVGFFCGLVIPLPLFPDWAQTTLAWLPFAGVGDLPFRVYSGALPLAAVPLVLAKQLGWTLIFVVFGRWLFARGLRRVVVQGG